MSTWSQITLDGITVSDGGKGKLHVSIDGHHREIPYEYARELANHMTALCDTGRIDPRYFSGQLTAGAAEQVNQAALPSPLPIIDVE